mmetsp:Transcript_11843/g.35578  ORF Transcript_11843/g.35578 Transcript_11843/m.35578 type:complete len:215 (+) Transcript_11843:326-970(+)
MEQRVHAAARPADGGVQSLQEIRDGRSAVVYRSLFVRRRREGVGPRRRQGRARAAAQRQSFGGESFRGTGLQLRRRDGRDPRRRKARGPGDLAAGVVRRHEVRVHAAGAGPQTGFLWRSRQKHRRHGRVRAEPRRVAESAREGATRHAQGCDGLASGRPALRRRLVRRLHARSGRTVLVRVQLSLRRPRDASPRAVARLRLLRRHARLCAWPSL